MEELLEQWRQLDERIARLERQLLQVHRENAACTLLESIPGVGMFTATAVVSSFGRAEAFDSARRFASALGLTPREHSSGDKQVMLGISKRGNGYLRRLLVHGARSALRVRMCRPDCADDWAVRLAHRRGHNIAVCALAAKNARRIWAMLRSGDMFRSDYVQTKGASR